MKIKNRVKELRMIPAKELAPNPKNWRTHPEKQKNALKGVLAEIGYADALLARELPDGSLMLLDGHLRAETTPNQEVPVLILDINEEEADKLLATLDPLAAMAGKDEELLEHLIGSISFKNSIVDDMLGELLRAETPVESINDEEFDERLPEEIEGCDLSPDELEDIQGEDETAMERIIIVFDKNKKLELCEFLGLEHIDRVIYRLDEIPALTR